LKGRIAEEKAKAVFYLNAGVTLKLDVTLDYKNYSSMQMELRMHRLGEVLGGDFLYFESKE
jgi:hypothetical protein